MPLFLGIDTSNYTSSVSVYNSDTGAVLQQKKLLPVADGKLGLRQGDAVFSHVNQLGALIETLLSEADQKIEAVAVSAYPRDVEGSYMPCFLVGILAAQAISAAIKVPMCKASHQAGHVAAAIYSAEQEYLFNEEFFAFHFSGGTTECLLVKKGKENVLDIEKVASTLDLNAGQVVDRVGLLLGLSFPAGKELEKLALKSTKTFKIKPAMKGADCCLSGAENKCIKMLDDGAEPCDIAKYSLEFIAEAALLMTDKIIEKYSIKPLIYAGGVMSNSIIKKHILSRHKAFFAQPDFSCDNAAGVAILASKLYKKG